MWCDYDAWQSNIFKTVILCSGTFMNGIIHLGLKNYKGGRSGEPSAKGITKQLII